MNVDWNMKPKSESEDIIWDTWSKSWNWRFCPSPLLESWFQRSPSLHFFMIDDSSSSMLWKTNTTQIKKDKIINILRNEWIKDKWIKDKSYPYTTLPARCHTKLDERQWSRHQYVCTWTRSSVYMHTHLLFHKQTAIKGSQNQDQVEDLGYQKPMGGFCW